MIPISLNSFPIRWCHAIFRTRFLNLVTCRTEKTLYAYTCDVFYLCPILSWSLSQHGFYVLPINTWNHKFYLKLKYFTSRHMLINSYERKFADNNLIFFINPCICNWRSLSFQRSARSNHEIPKWPVMIILIKMVYMTKNTRQKQTRRAL